MQPGHEGRDEGFRHGEVSFLHDGTSVPATRPADSTADRHGGTGQKARVNDTPRMMHEKLRTG